MEYKKIQTLLKRDDKNIIIPNEFTLDEFDYLKDCKWECTEKIDGTNMRIEVNNGNVEYKGRTDRANIPNHLYKYMCNTFPADKVFFALSKEDKPTDVNVPITIYGEGYGMKIQNGGNYIKDGVGFILFDVRVGDWWLNRKDCEGIAQKLNIKIVPIIGYMTINEAINYVKNGFKSTIAENKDYDAEGLVLRTPCGLKFRNGNRIIAKIKHVDFVKYNNSLKNK